MGVLFRSADALERLAKVEVLVVDKTGTLTEGKPRVSTLAPRGDISETTLLRLAASLERASEHPLASALIAAAEEREIPLASPEDVRTLAGKGIVGTVEGRTVALGNARLMSELGVAFADEGETAAAPGAALLLAAIDQRAAGVIGIADPIKQSAADAIAALKAEGIRIVMLSGDRRETAEAVGRVLAIDEVIAEVLPADKREVIQRLQKDGRVVAMAGDGVNDAPALAEADVGIAMGTGTEVAIQNAGITLVKGDLSGIIRARQLSRATMRNIRQNLGFAFGYNVLGVPIAAGILYPPFGVLLNPMIAAAAMSASSVSVVGNALRLAQFSPER